MPRLSSYSNLGYEFNYLRFKKKGLGSITPGSNAPITNVGIMYFHKIEDFESSFGHNNSFKIQYYCQSNLNEYKLTFQ